MADPPEHERAAFSQQEQLELHIQNTVNAITGPLHEQIARLREQLSNHATAAPTPRSPVVPPMPEPYVGPGRTPFFRSKPLPSPPKFSGKRNEYAAWSQQMRDKIRLDEHFFAGWPEIWYLIYSCLDTQPQQVVATFYQAGGPGGSREPAAFMEYLDRTYADQNIQARAAASLRTLRQRDDQALAQFLRRFEKTIAQAGGTHWPDNAKITFLEGALNPQLRSCLVSASLPTDYNGWVSRAQEVAGRLEGLKVFH